MGTPGGFLGELVKRNRMTLRYDRWAKLHDTVTCSNRTLMASNFKQKKNHRWFCTAPPSQPPPCPCEHPASLYLSCAQTGCPSIFRPTPVYLDPISRQWSGPRYSAYRGVLP